MGDAGQARAAKKGGDSDHQGSKVVFTVAWWVDGASMTWGSELGSCGLSVVDLVCVLNDMPWVLSSVVLFEADMIHRKSLSFPSWSQLPHVSAPAGNKALSLCFPGQEKYKLHFLSCSLSRPV